MPAIPTHPDKTPTYIYNPSKEDFTHNFNGHPYTLPSRQLIKFPKYLADHLAKHLASKLAMGDSAKIHFEERLNKWKKEIYIEL